MGRRGFDAELFDRRAANAALLRMASNGWAQSNRRSGQDGVGAALTSIRRCAAVVEYGRIWPPPRRRGYRPSTAEPIVLEGGIANGMIADFLRPIIPSENSD